MDTIYNSYVGRRTSFETSLNLIEDVLNQRLDSSYRRVMVQGTNTGKSRITICLTAFPVLGQYELLFVPLNNFRNFRCDCNDDEFHGEVELMERQIANISSGLHIFD